MLGLLEILMFSNGSVWMELPIVSTSLYEMSKSHNFFKLFISDGICFRAVARALIGGGGGCIFIYSGSARLVSFEMKLISKEVSREEPDYMNIHPPIRVLATALICLIELFFKDRVSRHSN